MKGWFRKGVLAAAIFLPALSGTQIAVSAQSGQEQEGKEQQPLEGVWDISITIRSCTTGAALATGRAIQIFIDGGTMTEVADRANRSAGLGTWHHLGGRSYATHHEFIEYSAAGSFNERRYLRGKSNSAQTPMISRRLLLPRSSTPPVS